MQGVNAWAKKVVTLSPEKLTSCYSENIQILNRVNLVTFIYILKEIHTVHPCVSFAYIIEANEVDDIEAQVYLRKLKTLDEEGLLEEIYPVSSLKIIRPIIMSKSQNVDVIDVLMKKFHIQESIKENSQPLKLELPELTSLELCDLMSVVDTL